MCRDNILEFLQNKFWSSNKFENCGDYLMLFTLGKGYRTSKPKAGAATIHAIRSVMPIDKYTGKLDHSPLVVVEAELGQVWPFCCWYSTTMLIHRK